MQTSPLRYPGGKSRAVKIITAYFPKGLQKMSSHFVGGGSIELYTAQQGIEVNAYDNFNLLINFWNQLKYNKQQLHSSIVKYLPIVTKDHFNELQQSISQEVNELKLATMFYVLNRCSFSGSTLSGGMSPNHPRFNKNNVDKLLNISLENIDFECMDFIQSIVKHKSNFKYLDPPYYIKNNLYGVKGDTHKRFDHLGLSNVLKGVNNWVMSYNDCEYIRNLYGGCKFIELDWKYGMSKNKKSNEIIIIN